MSNKSYETIIEILMTIILLPVLIIVLKRFQQHERKILLQAGRNHD